MHAGLGSASITPSLPVALAGYGNRHGLATTVHDDLRVHALVIDDGDTNCCLLTFDLLLLLVQRVTGDLELGMAHSSVGVENLAVDAPAVSILTVGSPHGDEPAIGRTDRVGPPGGPLS